MAELYILVDLNHRAVVVPKHYVTAIAALSPDEMTDWTGYKTFNKYESIKHQKCKYKVRVLEYWNFQIQMNLYISFIVTKFPYQHFVS